MAFPDIASFGFFPLFFLFFKDMETNTEFFIIVLQERFWLQSMWRITCRYQWRKAKTPASMSQSRWHNHLSTPSVTLHDEPQDTWDYAYTCLFHISTLSSIAVPSNLMMQTPSAATWPVLLPLLASMEPTAWSRLRCVSQIGVWHNLETFVANECHVVLGRPLAGVQRSSPVRSIWLDRSPGWPGQGPFPADLSSWTCCYLGRPVCLGRTQRFSSFAIVSVEFRDPAELQCVLFISPQVVLSGLTRASPSPMPTAGSFSWTLRFPFLLWAASMPERASP